MSKALSLFQLSLCTIGCLYATSNTTLAQVTSDGTVNTQVTQTSNVSEITGGQTRGSNLFHSFREFSVGTGNEAFFNNADSISNIFSRVTGGSVSNIDGLIRANGSASLFLINPAGIIFGEGASLDIGGSFYGSSASSILFEEGEFSATDLDNPPVLTINGPIGLNLRDNPSPVQGRNIQTDDDPISFTGSVGQNLALIGGDIDLKNTNLNLDGGQITIGGLSSAGTVQINEDGSLSFPSGVPLANVLLENSALNLESSQGGSISIKAEDLILSENSSISANVIEESAGNQIESGNIEILANNIALTDNSAIQVFTFDKGDGANLLIDAYSIFLESSQITSGVGVGGIGNSGNISINTGSLSLTNGSEIGTLGFGQGDTGDLKITAEDISLEGDIEAFDGFSSAIATSSVEGGTGNSGDIEIASRSLSLFNGAYIFAGVSGQGNAGNINIDVEDDIRIDGINDENFSAGIFSRIFEQGQGNGGNINIVASSIFLSNGGQINSSTDGLGDAGNINIVDADIIEIDGQGFSTTGYELPSGIFSQVSPTGFGNAGNTYITTTNLSVTNEGQISVGTFSEGNGGGIKIKAEDINLINGSISSSVEAGSNGNAGDIYLTTSSLTIADGGSINAGTFGEGDGGNIKVSTIQTSVSGSNQDGLLSGIFANSGENAEGNAGSISIDTKNLSIANNATITVDSQSKEGNGGEIFVSAESLELDDNASISATTTSGRGGNTSIDISDDLRLRNNSNITAGVFGNANGGEVLISADSLELDNNASISATTTDDFTSGGNIGINISDDLRLRNNSNITAKTFGNGGNVFIDVGFIIAYPSQIPGDGNDIIADAAQGRGGSISISNQAIFNMAVRQAIPGNGTNDIFAANSYESPNLTPRFNFGLENVPQIISSEQTTEQACSVNQETGKANGLTVKGKGGVPPAPDLPLNSQSISINGEVVPSISAIPEPIETSFGKIQPARGIKVSKDGRVTLTAYRTNNAGERIPEIEPNCNSGVSMSN